MRTVEPIDEISQVAAPAEDEPEDDPFAEPEEQPTGDEPTGEDKERMELVTKLEEYSTVSSLSKKSKSVIDGLLANEKATNNELREAVEKLDAYFADKGAAR